MNREQRQRKADREYNESLRSLRTNAGTITPMNSRAAAAAPEFDYYATRRGDSYELRQPRFREQLRAGNEHPHDLCATATGVQQLRETVAQLTGRIDWSELEPAALLKSWEQE